MLTPKENFYETIRGGNPEYYSSQFDFMELPFSDPWNATNPYPVAPGDKDATDYWGVTWTWPESMPGAFPVHGPGYTVVEDIENWKSCVTAPPLQYADELWKAAEEDFTRYDRSQKLVCFTAFPGLFECTHNLMGMENAMISFYTNPDEMHELINFIADWEIAYIKEVAAHLHPEAVFHHDDWGSSRSTFLSPEMFREFYLEPYKRLYGAYRENGFKVIIHHSDSFAATFVPFMIEMGIDVWQGGTILNDIPSLVKKYGGKISFMTGIDNQLYDKPDWSREEIKDAVWKICGECGTKYFLPCQTEGGPMASHEGFYEAVGEEIRACGRKMFPASDRTQNI